MKPLNCKNVNVVTFICDRCVDDYTLVAGKCVSKNEYQNLCSQMIDEVCVKCALRAYKSSEEICISVSEFCLNFDEKTKKCLSCDKGYTLKNGDCLKLSQDPFCADANT